MAIFYTEDFSFSTSAFVSMTIINEEDSNVQLAGLSSVVLRRDIGGPHEPLKVFTGPRQQASEVFQYINNFWFSETTKKLPKPRAFTIDEIEKLFPEIVRDDHVDGEFGLFKISGNVVLFLYSESEKLSDESSQTRYGDMAYTDVKKEVLEVMYPFVNPSLFDDFKKYINGDQDLEEFHREVKRILEEERRAREPRKKAWHEK